MPKYASSGLRWARLSESIFNGVTWCCGLVGILVPATILLYLSVEGGRALSWQFLTDRPRGFPLGMTGGIWPAVQGSFALAGIGLLVALPPALAGGIWLAEFSRGGRIARVARFLNECLAAVPSVIYGLFGYAFFVVALRLGVSLLAGALVLALVMFPIILVSVHESLAAVGPEYREAALSLGVDVTCAVRRVVLRKALPGIVAGVILAVGHAVGSAAPVLFTASVYFRQSGLALKEPVMTLPTHLYNLVSEAVSFQQAFGTALVLVVGLLFFNVLAQALRRLGERA